MSSISNNILYFAAFRTLYFQISDVQSTKKFSLEYRYLEPPFILGWYTKWHRHFEKFLQFPKKLKVQLPHDPVTLLLNVYLKGTKTHIHPKTQCTSNQYNNK